MDELDKGNISAVLGKQDKQTGAELGQAQLKLGLDLTSTSLHLIAKN